MLTESEIKHVVGYALQTGKDLYIAYRDLSNEITYRVITPLAWDTDYKLRAYCHMRHAERNFVLRGFMSIEIVEGSVERNGTTAPLYEPEQYPEPSQHTITHVEPVIQRMSAPVTAKRHVSKPVKPAGPVVKEVNSADAWRRLVDYYADCLIQEYQQQYLIEVKDKRYLFFPSEPPTVRQFLAGQISLQFERQKGRSELERFVADPRYREQRLCLGYPILTTDQDRLAPLIFATVKVDIGEHAIELAAGDHEVSYAALRSLELDEETYAAVLDQCRQLEKGSPVANLQAIEGYLIKVIEEIRATPLKRTSADPLNIHQLSVFEYKLVESPCLFYVSGNQITGKLIEELKDLSSHQRWTSSPAPVRQLVTQVPPHSYPQVPARAEDKKVYITAINDLQRQATHAAYSESIAIVTGPPGTGKSQLVLNVIANAVLSGETVLFASRNNRAVDVVIDKLRDRYKFQGVVRTGNRDNRRQAAIFMQNVLSQLSVQSSRYPLQPLVEQYRANTVKLPRLEKLLEQVRDLTRRLHEAERLIEAQLPHLPDGFLELADSVAEDYSHPEYSQLLATLNEQLERARTLLGEKKALEERIVRELHGNTLRSTIVDDIYAHEGQWGLLGEGWLHQEEFSSLEVMSAYIDAWHNLSEALVAQYICVRLRTEVDKYAHARRVEISKLPRHHLAVVEQVSQRATSELQDLQQQSMDLEAFCSAAVNGRLGWWQRLLIKLGFKRPYSRLAALYERMEVPVTLDETDDILLVEVATSELIQLLQVAILEQELRSREESLEQHEARLGRVVVKLPVELAQEVENIAVSKDNASDLHDYLERLYPELHRVTDERQALNLEIRELLLKRDSKLVLSLNQKPSAMVESLLRLESDASISTVASLLQNWSGFLKLWKTCAARRVIRVQLDEKPTESELLTQLSLIQNILDDTGLSILKGKWREHVERLDAGVIRRASDYAKAVELLTGEERLSNYGELIGRAEGTTSDAMQVFPVWATTNLAAKTNLPLVPGLFDLVVIDEASQCDVPSALPLLYRAKRALIIGDAQQLRHVATLSSENDAATCNRYGVAQEVFSYRERSLFDLADRNTKPQPGYILLREHYRSHTDIIEFSNQEFYRGELIVRTDMDKRGVPPTVQERTCGVFWLHTPGRAQHPNGKSAINQEELATVSSLLPLLCARLQEVWSDATLGVVTPYRAQRTRLAHWVETNLGQSIIVGTAHTFQGDERDVLIFSPVLADGLKEGSLNWLTRTANLLNVAVTRARCTLIIVGDWQFCNSLPDSNPYGKLARYVSQLGDDAICHDIQQLPLLQ